MFKLIARSAASEWRRLLGDRWLKSLVTWVPVLFTASFLLIFSAASPRDLPVAVVDNDRSSLSRQLIRYIDASPSLTIENQFGSVADGMHSLKDATVYGLVVVPAGFARDTQRAEAPSVTTFFNAQYLLIAKSIRSTLYQIEGTLAAELEIRRAFDDTPVYSAALAEAVPVRSQVTALYNSNVDYARFLMPGILAAFFQILICCATVLSLGTDGAARWRARSMGWLIGKTLPYTGLFLAHGLLTLWLFFAVLGWPHHGSIASLVPIWVSFILACQCVGALFYALLRDTVRALSLAGAFSAPAFAFIGLTFPASDMSVFAKFWRELMPASHYIEAYIAEVNYGGGPGGSLGSAVALLAYVVLLPLILRTQRSAGGG